MSEFINTIDVLGDDAVIDSIINRTITEFCDDRVAAIGNSAFKGCNSLVAVKAPSAKTVSSRAFEGCNALTYLDVSGATTISIWICYNCPSLVEVHAEQATLIDTSAFNNCKALKKIVCPNVQTVGGDMVTGCSSLESIDLPNVKTIWNGAFSNSALSMCIIRRTSDVCTLKGLDFANTPIANGTGHIYVPRALVDSYKAATNWSTYASQFRALEDYTVDGTITGELDETKI